MTETKRLANKSIIISGGSRGLGRALVEEFAALGANVTFTFNQDQSSADELKAFLNKNWPQQVFLSFKADVQDSARLMEVKEELQKANFIPNIIVNNAGISQAYPFPLMNEQDWQTVLRTNVEGIFAFTHAFLPFLVRQRKGHVLNIGSLAGAKVLAAPVHYAASKSAVLGFTETLAKEVGRYQIQVNCLAPGLLEDGVARQVPEENLKEFLSHLALGRTGSFSEIARFAGFLVCDENSYMTGSTLVVDGGF